MRASAIGKSTPMSPNAPATSSLEIGQRKSLSSVATAVSNPSSPRRRTNDHDLGGLDQRRRRFAYFQFQVAAGVAGDHGSDNLSADVERHLGEQPDGLEA